LKLVFEREPGDEAVGRSREKTRTGIETRYSAWVADSTASSQQGENPHRD